MKHAIPIRVYYEDTDAGGIVYHSNYLKFAERGRTEMLRHLNYSITDLLERENIMFVMRHVEMNYLAPARLDEQLSLETTLQTIKNTSFVMRQCVIRDGTLLCEMLVTLVCVDTNSFKPVRVPEGLRAALGDYLEEGTNEE